MAESTGIEHCMRKVMLAYQKLKGRQIDRNTTQFWDIVVITTADEEQKKVYEAQIEEKIRRNELPLGIPIHVFADRPGPKVGNGGSTFASLQKLDILYPTDLYTKRILLIHAGGQSKRMPSTSVLGKIFSPIPSGSSVYQMLDLKLAIYLPFLEKMPAGIFLTCADDFMVYNLGEDPQDWSFSEHGFTAFAHPSTLEIGVKHGVYVLKDVDATVSTHYVHQHECLEVLQKPSKEVMYKKNAVLAGRNHKFPDGMTFQDAFAYTDSSYFFGSDITKKLIDFVNNNDPITCEIDAYGDILQAAGQNASRHYITNISNVSQPTSSLLPTREKVFDLLKGSSVRLILLNSSRYIHIGTSKEYIYHFCLDAVFQKELDVQKDSFNRWSVVKGRSAAPKQVIEKSNVLGCIMHSSISCKSFIPKTSVVEFCRFDIPVKVGNKTIVSNCQYVAEELGSLSSTESTFFQIPNNLFLHTVPVIHNDTLKYVTILYDINDDLKKRIPCNKVMSLPFLGRTIGIVCKVFDLDPECLLPQSVECENDVSLWDLSLFTASDTMSASLHESLSIQRAIASGESISGFRNRTLFSMNNILRYKNVEKMLEIRHKLFSDIEEFMNCR